MLEIYYGPMFSGKSDSLAKRAEEITSEGKKIIAFKPSIDNRFSKNDIVSRTGRRIEAYSVMSEKDIESVLGVRSSTLPEYLFFDEVQFFDSSVIELVKELSKELNIVAGGLDLDYMGKPFEMTSELLKIADVKNQLYAYCSVEGCKCNACNTFKKNISSGVRVEIGDVDLYESRCHKHWLEGMKEQGF